MNPKRESRGEAGPIRLLLICVVVAALTAFVTTMLTVPAGGEGTALASDQGRQTPPAEATTPPAVPAAPVDLAGLRHRVEELTAKVARLEQGGRRRSPIAAAPIDQETRIKELLDRIRAVEHGEQQVVLEMATRDLIRIGPPVVDPVAARLAEGHDRIYSKGYSTSGGRFRSYPRYRTVLFDLLTQVGSDQALTALLAAVQASDKLLDYRDLLIMFGNTRNPIMLTGMDRLIPGILARLGKLDRTDLRDQGMGDLPRQVFQWIGKRNLGELAIPLAAYLQSRPKLSYDDGAAFSTLLRLSEEEAIKCLRQMTTTKKDIIRSLIGPNVRRIPRARLASLYRHLLESTTGDKNILRHLIIQLPHTTCSEIKDKAARIADAQVLINFYSEMEKTQTDRFMRQRLQRSRTSLEKEIAELSAR